MMNRRRSRIIYLLALMALLSVGIVAQRMKGLAFEHHLPRGKNGDLSATSLAAYIFGGTQDSLSYKWKTVGRLYSEGTVRKIFVLHRPGITEYSPVLGRNLTNDEWAIGKLKEEGVAVDAVEFVSVPPATFATFAEAREISALARTRRVKRLALISSTHHTKRVWLSISYFNTDNAFEPYTYGSEERPGVSELLMENLKLLMYRYIVIPIDRLRGRFRE